MTDVQASLDTTVCAHKAFNYAFNRLLSSCTHIARVPNFLTSHNILFEGIALEMLVKKISWMKWLPFDI
jgi:hypothetical protein